MNRQMNERTGLQMVADFLSLTPEQMAEHAPRLKEDPIFQAALHGVIRDCRVRVAYLTRQIMDDELLATQTRQRKEAAEARRKANADRHTLLAEALGIERTE